jgi:hypothetical protein
MERSWTKSLILNLVNLSSLLILLSPIEFGTVQADVLLAPPMPPPPLVQAGEAYPESRFGAPPAIPDLGGSASDRKPAGLEFSQTPGEARPRAVIADQSMPRSIANTNPVPNSTGRTGIQEVSLIAGDLGFFPKTIFVTRDIPVRLYVTGASKKPLCIMMDSFQVRKQIRSQQIEEINFVPNLPGKYRFYCPVNGMEGTLLVKELAFLASDPQKSSGSTLGQTSSAGE